MNIRHCISASGHLGLWVNSQSPEILPLAPAPAWPGRRGRVEVWVLSPPLPPSKECWSCRGSSPPPCPLQQGLLHHHHSAGERTSHHSRGAVSPCLRAGLLVGCRFGRRGVRCEGHGSGGTVTKKTFFIFMCLCSHCLTVFFYLGECLPLLLGLLLFSEETS